MTITIKRYYFTNEDSYDIMYDRCEYLEGAITKARKYAKENNEIVVINDCATEDIVNLFILMIKIRLINLT